jgi:uroporphyrin-III C-methyltransferase
MTARTKRKSAMDTTIAALPRIARPAAAAAPGLVTLVGAGPGDPELLTLKAARAIAAARLVLYDQLVSHEVLELLPADAERIYVGKRSAHHALPQEEIIALMLALARSGRAVLRLKGGDPYIFGRGGEEAQALAEAGVPFEVIPGISAAQGAAAAAGIPLTHRDHAASVTCVTGHLRAGTPDEFALDWPALARARQTLVVYMGVAALPVISRQLVRHGLAPDTPAAVIEHATLPTQRTLVGTLATLPALARQQRVKSPALIVIGAVVSLHAQLGAPRANEEPAPARALAAA